MSYTAYGLVAVLTRHSYEEVRKDIEKLLSTVEKRYSKLVEQVDYYMQCVACNYIVMVFTYSEELLNNRDLAQEIDNIEKRISERAIAIYYCAERCLEISDNICNELIRRCIDRQLR